MFLSFCSYQLLLYLLLYLDFISYIIIIIVIIAGRAALVEAINASSRDDLTSTLRDDQLAANSTAACNFMEDVDLSLINHGHKQH